METHLTAMQSRTFLILFSCLTISIATHGQADSTVNRKTYRTWVSSYKRNQLTSGILYEIKDSSVRILRAHPVMVHHKQEVMATLNARTIDNIKLRSKGSIGKGMLIGGIIGAVVGTLISVSIAKHDNKTPEVYITPIMFAGFGVGLGTLFGSIKINIPINGNTDLFNYYRGELNKYAKHRNF